ncbi:MAG TPA: molybdenum cofactor biosynthesis protein [Candidatus Mediterraneibacter stercoravium]|uniref:Molybdenum cofactor biosynthesis protein n=1 Tax=Candidatus Mediterraneibacter stercoravium TaxID=2838685 RepID=A0A9D2G999_9FIRM|nr:molybdenum cofactor biosynthesis protein [Candidatus Mediterraneibacter stercoravium]
MRAAIFTLDTGAYKAKAESAAATALKRMLEHVGFEVRAASVLPQERAVLASVLKQLADSGSVDLILTTGAVEYRERDCAPDALADVADRLLPGIPEALRAYNIRYSKKIILDRSAAGIRKKTLIINLPESAKMAKEDMEYILPEVVQVVETMSL